MTPQLVQLGVTLTSQSCIAQPLKFMIEDLLSWENLSSCCIIKYIWIIPASDSLPVEQYIKSILTVTLGHLEETTE